MKKILFFIAILITKLSVAQIPTNGLVGYWPFNENATDESENGNDGTVYGAILTTDRFGNENSAYSLDGDGDYINVGNSSSLQITESLTISVWIKTTYTTQNQKIINKDDGSNRSYTLLVRPNGTILMGLWISDNDYIVSSISDIADNNWHHIVGMYDGTNMSIFIDGKFDINYSISGNIDNDIVDLEFGRRGDNILFYDGLIDDIRIYNRALAEQEITALYNENEGSIVTNTWIQNGNNIYFDGTGNVGIGTDNPAAKLTVDGPTLSTEIKVKTDISTYPDFVFKPEYKLRTLPDLERFIKVNGHLPEIPNTVDVKEGVNLGEMNTRLLQKIEELTLYTIEQNKKIEKQQQEMKALKEKVEKLMTEQ